MARIVLENGNWFEEDQAERYEERELVKPDDEGITQHSNLYLTKKGKWVYNSWEEKEGQVSNDCYKEADAGFAYWWFTQNGYDADEIPQEGLDPENEI